MGCKNNVKFDSKMTSTEVNLVKAAIRNWGHSPAGQKAMSIFQKNGGTLNIFSESSSPYGPNQGPHVGGGTDNMYFSGNFSGSSLGQTALGLTNAPWWKTATDDVVFGHEFGHLKSSYNVSDEPYTNSQPGNTAQSENPYRAWRGLTRREGYETSINNNTATMVPVPYRSFPREFIEPWRHSK